MINEAISHGKWISKWFNENDNSLHELEPEGGETQSKSVLKPRAAAQDKSLALPNWEVWR